MKQSDPGGFECGLRLQILPTENRQCQLCCHGWHRRPSYPQHVVPLARWQQIWHRGNSRFSARYTISQVKTFVSKASHNIHCHCARCRRSHNRPFAIYPIIVISQNSHWRQCGEFYTLLPRQGMVVGVVVKGVTEPRCGGLAWFPWSRTPGIHLLPMW